MLATQDENLARVRLSHSHFAFFGPIKLASVAVPGIDMKHESPFNPLVSAANTTRQYNCWDSWSMQQFIACRMLVLVFSSSMYYHCSPRNPVSLFSKPSAQLCYF